MESSSNGLTVVFIHGLWLHATSWNPWSDLFQAKGYHTIAPGWPGDADTVATTREHAHLLAGYGITEVTNHFAKIVRALDQPVIAVGHSFGGMIAQRLLGEDMVAAAVGIDAAQIRGVRALPLSALRATGPVLRDVRNRKKAISLTPKQFHYAFANTVSRQASDQLYETWSIPAPGRPLFQAAAANFVRHSPASVATHNSQRGPLLLTLGGRDNTVPPAVTKSTARLYRSSPALTEVLEFHERGHSLTIDAGWPAVATAIIEWLDKVRPLIDTSSVGRSSDRGLSRVRPTEAT